MKFIIQNNNGYTLSHLMRRLGYVPFHDSFVRRITRDYYPRFHIYVDERSDSFLLKMHLDQKKESYQGQTAHSADYEDSLALEDEKERILSIIIS